jgi:chromosome segregation ATPase
MHLDEMQKEYQEFETHLTNLERIMSRYKNRVAESTVQHMCDWLNEELYKESSRIPQDPESNDFSTYIEIAERIGYLEQFFARCRNMIEGHD